jgi:TPR repeat protein
MIIMSKVKILFFAADPHSTLRLDEDVRQIRKKVSAAGHREDLFDWRLAARPDDLLHALNETRPRVVHFSGHGIREGLVLVGSDGRPHLVPAAGLTELFQTYRGRIRLVVLNACFSLEQAKAIAEVVGCAIGTRHQISDDAAITFGSEFYLALVSGRSVKVAFERARAALAIKHPDEVECPQLVPRNGVDPSRLVVFRPRLGPVARIIAGAALVGAAVVTAVKIDRSPGSLASQPGCGWGMDRSAHTLTDGLGVPAAASGSPVDPSGGSDLAAAKILYRAGNYAAAFVLFERVAKGGNPEAMAFLGELYMRGQGTAVKRDSAYRWLHEAATKGNLRGMTELGSAYQNGAGVDRSLRWAEHWYAKAAELGSVEAMRKLGNFYRDERNHYSTALFWYRNAVRVGSLDAMVEAGLMYEGGLGVPQDLDEARCLYRTAADAGSQRGMVAMGQIYQDSVGVPRDYEKAKEWYLKAVGAGSADAMKRMGDLYKNGWGVQQSDSAAIQWYRRAREASSTVAAANLAAMGAN